MEKATDEGRVERSGGDSGVAYGEQMQWRVTERHFSNCFNCSGKRHRPDNSPPYGRTILELTWGPIHVYLCQFCVSLLADSAQDVPDCMKMYADGKEWGDVLAIPPPQES